MLLLAGYPMSFSDAKAWALRNWPDMNIQDDEELPNIIYAYHAIRGLDFRCIMVEVNDELVVFFPLAGEEDPRSTPYRYKQLPETEGGLKFRTWLFKNRWDQELAEKTKWITVADPYFDWRRAERYRARKAAYDAAQRRSAMAACGGRAHLTIVHRVAGDLLLVCTCSISLQVPMGIRVGNPVVCGACQCVMRTIDRDRVGRVRKRALTWPAER